MDNAHRDDLVRRLDGLEERVRRLEQHTAAVFEQIVALRQGLDEALRDLVDDEDAEEGGAPLPQPGVRH
ncbi:hypothetical protein [Azospirillum sp. A39]